MWIVWLKFWCKLIIVVIIVMDLIDQVMKQIYLLEIIGLDFYFFNVYKEGFRIVYDKFLYYFFINLIFYKYYLELILVLIVSYILRVIVQYKEFRM